MVSTTARVAITFVACSSLVVNEEFDFSALCEVVLVGLLFLYMFIIFKVHDQYFLKNICFEVYFFFIQIVHFPFIVGTFFILVKHFRNT